MNEVMAELTEKVAMFNGAEDAMAQKELELNRLQGNLKTNTNRMYTYETLKDKLQVRLQDAEFKLKSYTAINEQVTRQLDMFQQHQYSREQEQLAEIEKNKQLNAQIKDLEEQLLYVNTHAVYNLKMEKREATTRISQLEQEIDALKQAAELNMKLAEEEISLLKTNVDLATHNNRMF